MANNGSESAAMKKISRRWQSARGMKAALWHRHGSKHHGVSIKNSHQWLK